MPFPGAGEAMGRIFPNELTGSAGYVALKHSLAITLKFSVTI